jgi:nitrogen-specific signal transduction histidine kinase
LQLLGSQRFSVVVSDYQMPGTDGLTLLMRARELDPDGERILLTAYADAEAMERGINDVAIHRIMHKPWHAESLLAVVKEAKANNRVRRERTVLLERLRHRNDELAYVNSLLTDRVAAGDLRAQLFRRRWDAALDAIGDVIIVVGAELRIEGANAGAESLAGQPRNVLEGELCHQMLFQRHGRCPGCPIGAGPARLKLRRGNAELCLDARAYPLPGDRTAHLCIYRDVTQQVLLEQQAAHQTKMAAIGRLASGVAHEVNNPLQAILTFVQLAEKPDATQEKIARTLQVVRESALRCRDIVKALRDFSRRDTDLAPEPVDVNNLCAQVAAVFNATGKPRVQLALAASACASGRPGQLHQVLVNLVQNAVDAGPEGAVVRVSTAVDGKRVSVIVDDDGPGIASELRTIIFEPFYTTKPAGKGTGLGLAISHRIVVEHGGTIQVLASPTGGARMQVHLPVADNGGAGQTTEHDPRAGSALSLEAKP